MAAIGEDLDNAPANDDAQLQRLAGREVDGRDRRRDPAVGLPDAPPPRRAISTWGAIVARDAFGRTDWAPDALTPVLR